MRSIFHDMKLDFFFEKTRRINMSDIKSSTLELVGKTPIVNASRYAAKAGVTDAAILVKLEAFKIGRAHV